MWVGVGRAMGLLWRSEDTLQDWVLSFHHGSPRDPTQQVPLATEPTQWAGPLSTYFNTGSEMIKKMEFRESSCLSVVEYTFVIPVFGGLRQEDWELQLDPLSKTSKTKLQK